MKEKMLNHSKCLLITGMGHSGTRLLVDILGSHPDVWKPEPKEFSPLHCFFIQVLDSTPIYASDYVIDYNELEFIMDAYLEQVDTHKRFHLLKLPYYPLMCLDFLMEYYQGNIEFLFTNRPIDKIIGSYMRRGEDYTIFRSHVVGQVKKLSVEQRKGILAKPVVSNAGRFFQELHRRCLQLRDDWDSLHPEQSFVEVDIEKISQSKQYLINILNKIGLDSAQFPCDAINEVVQIERLMHPYKSSRTRTWSRIKQLIRRIGA